MKWLFNLLKQFSFWLIVGFLFAAVLLVIIGILLDWSNEVKILSIVILIFLLIFVLMFRNLRSARGIQKVEQSIETPLSYIGPERKKEIEQFRTKMHASIQSLKKSQLSKFKKGKSNLYSLPWYIFIGAQNSGKTTVIEQSGLTFPSGIETAKATECEFLLASSSILVDTAGRIIEEEEQGSARGEWYALLEILRKYRKRQPLNGKENIVSVSR
jgi:type VI secretion system protein ImpL